MKIVLFGDKGQVGEEVREYAENRQHEVVGYDINNIDIADFKQVETAFLQNADADIVINAAAYTAVDKAEDERDLAYAINCDAVKNLAVQCHKHNMPLMHISTDYVFSGDEDKEYVETDATEPKSVYGKSKLAGEEELRKNCSQHIILRISWVFGRYGNNFVKTILRLAKEKESLGIVADQHGCPTAAKDVARVLVTLAEKIKSGIHKWGTYHYCNKPVTTWHEFAEKIVELGRKKYKLLIKELKKLSTAEYPTKTKRPKNSAMSVAKILREYTIEQLDWLDYLIDVIDEVDL